MLILGNKKGSTLPNVATTNARTSVNRHSSYANVVPGNLRDAYSKQLLRVGLADLEI